MSLAHETTALLSVCICCLHWLIWGLSRVNYKDIKMNLQFPFEYNSECLCIIDLTCNRRHETTAKNKGRRTPTTTDHRLSVGVSVCLFCVWELNLQMDFPINTQFDSTCKLRAGTDQKEIRFSSFSNWLMITKNTFYILHWFLLRIELNSSEWK